MFKTVAVAVCARDDMLAKWDAFSAYACREKHSLNPLYAYHLISSTIASALILRSDDVASALWLLGATHIIKSTEDQSTRIGLPPCPVVPNGCPAHRCLQLGTVASY